MTPTEAFALTALLIWIFLFVQGVAGIRATRVLQPRSDVGVEVTAYVPARDEAEIIEACIVAALADPQVRQLVAIDDRSEDGTAKILERLRSTQERLRVVEGTEPAAGACGKPSALVRGYEAHPPETDWLLFLDADVVLAPGAIGSLIQEAEDRGADLITLIPTVTLGSFLERLVMPAIGALILAHHPPRKVGDPDSKKAFANGQVIVVRRRRYEAAGGHAAVIGQVLEDVALARRIKADGGRLQVVDGRHLATTRMYDGWSDLAEGWTKNLFLLLDARLSTALGWAGAALVLGSLGWAALLVDRGPVGLAAFAGIVSMQAYLRKLGGAQPAYAIVAPVGAILAAGLVLVSAWRHTVGAGVAWKGRRYR